MGNTSCVILAGPGHDRPLQEPNDMNIGSPLLDNLYSYGWINIMKRTLQHVSQDS